MTEALRPLVVDMDGTLIGHDISGAVILSGTKLLPHRLYKLCSLWKKQGGGAAKDFFAQKLSLSPETLTYHQPVLRLCRAAREKGHLVILATASPLHLAKIVADYAGCFDDVMGSDATVNLKSEYKAAALITQYGERGFDYVGNSAQDLAVWKHAHTAYLVHPDLAVHGALLKFHDDVRPISFDVSLMQAVRRRVAVSLGVAAISFLGLIVIDPQNISPLWPITVFALCFGVMLIGDLLGQGQMMQKKSPPVLLYTPKIQGILGVLLIVASFVLPLVVAFLA